MLLLYIIFSLPGARAGNNANELACHQTLDVITAALVFVLIITYLLYRKLSLQLETQKRNMTNPIKKRQSKSLALITLISVITFCPIHVVSGSDSGKTNAKDLT